MNFLVKMLILRLDLHVTITIITCELIWSIWGYFNNRLGLHKSIDGDCEKIPWPRLLVGNLMCPYRPFSWFCMWCAFGLRVVCSGSQYRLTEYSTLDSSYCLSNAVFYRHIWRDHPKGRFYRLIFHNLNRQFLNVLCYECNRRPKKLDGGVRLCH